MQNARIEYDAACHCGALRLTYHTALEPEVWPLRHDGCSFCRKHGVIATSDPAGEVLFKFDVGGRVQRYRFGTKTADFLICGDCGIFVAAVTETPGGIRAVINARAFSDLSLDFGRVTVGNLDGESAEERQARRARNWTPVWG